MIGPKFDRASSAQHREIVAQHDLVGGKPMRRDDGAAGPTMLVGKPDGANESRAGMTSLNFR
jgi:hypothetical protein